MEGKCYDNLTACKLTIALDLFISSAKAGTWITQCAGKYPSSGKNTQALNFPPGAAKKPMRKLLTLNPMENRPWPLSPLLR